MAGASVFVDRRFVGKAPVDVLEVTPGPHRLNVSADGHEMYAEEIEVGSEPRTVSVRFNEVRLDESLPVVHKHGMGSCRGVLRAAAARRPRLRDRERQGLLPRAARRPRALRSGLHEEDAPRLLPGGRSYTFTVEGPSADPLLVFQQKVDKARKRLGR